MIFKTSWYLWKLGYEISCHHLIKIIPMEFLLKIIRYPWDGRTIFVPKKNTQKLKSSPCLVCKEGAWAQDEESCYCWWLIVCGSQLLLLVRYFYFDFDGFVIWVLCGSWESSLDFDIFWVLGVQLVVEFGIKDVNGRK